MKLFPPKVSRARPKWLNELPPDLRRLLVQTYGALDADSRALALMGARAVVDMLLVQHIGDVGGFAEKLKALETSGAIGAKNRDVLATALDAGSAAAHRGYEPGEDQIDAVMDIVENLLQAVYHLGSLASKLKSATPKRSNT